jgi:galactitol-specific phosphotransferase system IIB component
MQQAAAAAATADSADRRLLEAASQGKTDLVLQLLEEEGQTLHEFKDKVSSVDIECSTTSTHESFGDCKVYDRVFMILFIHIYLSINEISLRIKL